MFGWLVGHVSGLLGGHHHDTLLIDPSVHEAEIAVIKTCLFDNCGDDDIEVGSLVLSGEFLTKIVVTEVVESDHIIINCNGPKQGI